LKEFSKAIAPICPFISEEIFKNLTGKESVHLQDFPRFEEEKIDKELNDKMATTRKIIEMGLSLRAENGIKVRQPLSDLAIDGVVLEDDFLRLIKEEVNVKNILVQDFKEDNLQWKKDKNFKVGLNTFINSDLKLEGEMRGLIREVQQARKEAGFEVSDRIKLLFQGGEKIFDAYRDLIAREVLAEKISNFAGESSVELDIEKEIKIGNETIKIGLKKRK
jgi:isoleucyl-tRNA synthetase